MSSILISDKCSSEALEFLKKGGHTVVYNPEITPKQLLTEIPNHEALIVRSRTKVPKEVIAAASKLKVIGRAGSGVDTIDVAAAKGRNITVVNAPGANSETVAEHTITLMLALARNIVPISTALKASRWEKKTYQAIELAGKTLGIVGFGEIGARVSEIGFALGMKIIVFTRTQSPQKQEILNRIAGTFMKLNDLLKTADFVSLHLSGGDDTKGMIGAAQLQLMKKSAYLINCARGTVVDEVALTRVLQNHMIAGAALDVFATEPLDATNSFLKLDNVLLTPHIAAVSPEANARASMMVAQDIDRVLKGETAQHAV